MAARMPMISARLPAGAVRGADQPRQGQQPSLPIFRAPSRRLDPLCLQRFRDTARNQLRVRTVRPSATEYGPEGRAQCRGWAARPGMCGTGRNICALTSQVGVDVADLLVPRWSTEHTSRPVPPIARPAGCKWVPCTATPSKERVSPPAEILIHRSRSILSKGTSSGRYWRGRSAASHRCCPKLTGSRPHRRARTAADRLRR
jgi:hypothetical protein